MKKMSLAKSLDLTGTLQKDMEQFTIMDFANDLTKEKYRIRFGGTEEMPSCSCHDWKKTLLIFFLSIWEISMLELRRLITIVQEFYILNVRHS